MSSVTDAHRQGLREGLEIAVRFLERNLHEDTPTHTAETLQNAIDCFKAGIERTQR